MKKLILALSLALSVLTIPAMASEDTFNQDEYCGAMKTVAASSMHARQNRVDILTMVGIAKESFESETDGLREIALLIIKDAYEQPSYMTDEYKEQAIFDYSTEIYLMCINSQ